MVNSPHSINLKLYDLLKDILQLNESVTKFSLVVELDYAPVVSQTYFITGKSEVVERTNVKVLTD